MPCIKEWQMALLAKGNQSLREGASIWSRFLSSSLSKPTGIFRTMNKLCPLRLGKPKDLLLEVRPHLCMSTWKLHHPWLLEDLDEEEFTAFLALSSCPMAPRKIFDLKFKIATNTLILRLSAEPPTCPHCQMQDSIRHRFWDCPIALRERTTLHAMLPMSQSLSPAQTLLSPVAHFELSDRACLEAYIWRIHLLALKKLGVIKDSPLPIRTLSEIFASR